MVSCRRGIAVWVFVLALLASRASGEVFQWRVEVPIGQDQAGKPRTVTAYLWVPPAAERIRGVLIGGDILFESSFVADPAIRKACADEKLAIVQMMQLPDAILSYTPAEAGRPNVPTAAAEQVQAVLDKLGAASGYKELSVAPWFPYGHSVSTMFACHLSTMFPERTFGMLSFKGGVDKDTDPGRYASIPVLAIKGEFEEFGPAGPLDRKKGEDRTTSWKVMNQTLLTLRAADDRNLFSGILEPGATHFRWADDAYGAYVAMFIRKAAQRRIPDWAVDAREVKCTTIDPASGGLSSSDVFDPNRTKAGAYKAFVAAGGDPKKAYWHLDEELARATDAFYATHPLGKKPQFVAFSDVKSGKQIAVGHDLRGGLSHEWVGPETFRVAAGFVTDAVPPYYPEVPLPVGHATSAIKVYGYTNVVEPVPGGAELTFRPRVTGRRLKFEKDKNGKTAIPIRCDMIAVHPGDATYRHAEQMGRSKSMQSPVGADQSIVMEPLPKEVAASVGKIALAAKASSGLPVRFYVESGPAEVVGNELVFQDVPARGSAFEVKVVAWQYGSQVAPKFSPAEPVVQTVVVKR